MKFASRTLLVATLAFLSSGLASACEIAIAVDGNEKAKYEIGEIVVVRVTVELTHNNCPAGLQDTKIKGSGLDVLGATPWKNPSDRKWERKVKVKITSSRDGRATITAKRECQKDGGSGTLTLKTTPTK